MDSYTTEYLRLLMIADETQLFDDEMVVADYAYDNEDMIDWDYVRTTRASP